jgi:phosphoribosylformylglycinamidine (FGAM) synthase-like amidotransferase family enzyme
VLGLMPHPENHVVARQHPKFHRGESAGLGLALFQEGVRYVNN